MNRMKKTQKLIVLLIFMLSQAWSADTCSRTAVINYQEVLVDTSTSQKGGGLRFYLNKDPIAKSYLDKYQVGVKDKRINAFIGTTSIGLILAGLMVNRPKHDPKFGVKEGLLAGGAALFILNFFVASTQEYHQEENLERAVQEYNKRNLPRIYFSPFKNSSSNVKLPSKHSYGLMAMFSQEF